MLLGCIEGDVVGLVAFGYWRVVNGCGGSRCGSR